MLYYLQPPYQSRKARATKENKIMDRARAREELKPRLREYVESITTASKGRGMYICPLCGSGTGKHKSGAFRIQPCGTRWKCFACEASGDILDLIGGMHAASTYEEQLAIACQLFNIQLDGSRNYAKTRQERPADMHTPAPAQEQMEAPVDYTPLFLQASKRLTETDYLQRRGISADMAARFNLGYIAEWRHPKRPASVPCTPRLIIPTSPHSYLARDTRASMPKQQEEYKKMKVGQVHIFNIDVIKTARKPVFVVEGELDAISLIQSGAEAVGLGSIGMKRAFLEAVQQARPRCPFIISLDNEDKPQVKAAEEALEKGLEALGIPSYRYNPCGSYKDANEALQQCPEGLRHEVARIMQEVEDLQRAEERAMTEKYLQTSALYHLQDFRNGIKASVHTPAISTGFFYLDRALDGGFYEGLYIVGAISSLGKTTLMMQIADKIAEEGKDVLIFSLEMARSEIMAKSISRHTCQIAQEGAIDMKYAKTARGITDGARYAKYEPQEKKLIEDAIEVYSEYAGRLYIHEGVGNIGVEQVKNTIAEHIRLTGSAPVVIIDYLQILAPYSERATDKQNTDKAILELKRISRDFKLPIIGISSFNRAGYKEAVTMEAFKESGAIEYSSDVLIGLQLQGAGAKDFDVNEAKSKNPREIELVVLKNRNGKTGSKVKFRFYAMFNYFKEEPQ